MEKLRKDIDEKDRWDLTVLYKDDSEWEKDYEDVKKLASTLEKYKGHLLDNADTLYNFVKDYFDVERKLEKVYYYAHLNYDAETISSKYQGMDGKVTLLLQDISVMTTFVEPELMKSDYDTVSKFYETKKELKEYDRYFKEIYRYKKHTLSEKEEEILSKLGTSLGVSEDIYEKLTDSDLSFGDIKDESGNTIKLTDSNYSNYIRSNDRRVRKDAFKEMYRTYKGIVNTTCATLYGNILSSVNLSHLRNYNSAMEASLFADSVSKDIYDNLVKTVNSNLDVLYKYYDLKKEELGLDEFHLYDVYANLLNEENKTYSFEEAKEVVLKAIEPLGEEYVKDAKKAFDERWIDIYPSKGKRGGAYSSGGYDTYPYMLLNFEGKLDDVSTIIHELGHSMHSYYSKKNNSFQDYNYRIFVAEVASTTNEVLLCKYLLKNSNDKKVKLAILNRLMDLFKGTIYRQTMFAEFEEKIYDLVEKGEVLTPDLLCDMYYDINKTYFGPNTAVDEEIKYEWSRIPHFYYDFYVYKYATGLSAACYIANNILSGDTTFRDNYLKFLSLGGSMDPVDELKVAGVDMTSPEVIKSAIDMFNEIIEEYKELR